MAKTSMEDLREALKPLAVAVIATSTWNQELIEYRRSRKGKLPNFTPHLDLAVVTVDGLVETLDRLRRRPDTNPSTSSTPGRR